MEENWGISQNHTAHILQSPKFQHPVLLVAQHLSDKGVLICGSEKQLSYINIHLHLYTHAMQIRPAGAREQKGLPGP